MQICEHHAYKKDDIWNPAKCSCKNGKCYASITDDSVITHDEIIDAVDKLYKKATFSLITIAILIVVSVYCYLRNIEQKKNIYCQITSQISTYKEILY